MRGGLCQANILGSVIFAGMSGSAVADAAGLGTVEIEAMKKEGYDAETAAAITAASATIGPIIPPSLPMIVYGVAAETSIGGAVPRGRRSRPADGRRADADGAPPRDPPEPAAPSVRGHRRAVASRSAARSGR